MRSEPINRDFIFVAVVAIGVMSHSPVVVASTANPYRDAIFPRNLFSLTTPKKETGPIPPHVLRPIKLVGITSIFGGKVAILRVPSIGIPPGVPEKSVMLREGATQEGVQILEINVSAGTARIMNGDTEQLLDIHTEVSPSLRRQM